MKRTLMLKLTQILKDLPISSKIYIVFVLMVLCVFVFIFQKIKSNPIQKQINHRLLANKQVDLHTILPLAQVICVVPPKNHLYYENNIQHYLSYSKFIQLNNKIKAMKTLFYNNWYLVGVGKDSYQYYIMGSSTKPKYLSTQCVSIKEHSKIIISLTQKDGKEFDIMQ